jgi:allantoinase
VVRFDPFDRILNSYICQIAKQDLIFKNKLSPYEGMEVAGRVEQTFLRGRKVFDARAEEPFGGQVLGELLL